MGLRLILVGVVACLGLTMPTGEQLETWKVSAQTWMNARIAEWDAPMPADENAFVVVAEPTANDVDAGGSSSSTHTDIPGAQGAAIPGEAPAIRTAGTTTAPVGLAEGLEAPTTPLAFEESEPASPVVATAPKTAAPDAAFDTALNEVLSAFDNDRREAAALAAAKAPRYEPAELGENLYPGIAYDLNRAAEGLGGEVAAIDARPAGRFEPMEVGDDLYAGVAYALNREAEGLERADSPRLTLAHSSASRVAGSSDRLSHAVRLTREAMSAWANLLHGPAVVLITH